MQFKISSNAWMFNAEQNVAYLFADNWNDWFKYKTLYHLTYFDHNGKKHEIGSVKIGQFGMAEERPDLPNSFEKLDARFFSLGQDADYYAALMKLGKNIAIELLSALRDIVYDEDLYKQALEEDVTSESLLRYVNVKTIEGQFRRILAGGAKLTEYKFDYILPSRGITDTPPPRLKFKVKPDSLPPTNIHVLIGKNGVGKTFILNAMVRALISSDHNSEQDGMFKSIGGTFEEDHEIPFSNILSIAFSAFDNFEIKSQDDNAKNIPRYINVGLQKSIQENGQWKRITCDPETLAQEFSKSAWSCVGGGKILRWQKALTTLETDSLFAEAGVANLADNDENEFEQEAEKLYSRLSSGHKIVLLSITKLIENVDEKTLILIDEPEAHLHPPLLASFVRALSDLLIDRNGVAIIATHSPVVLQEIPSSCIWKIIRHGLAIKATRPTIETFAENVSILTREIFGLEVMRSGFYKMLSDAAKDENIIDDVVDKFDIEVGSEGRALISSIIASRNSSESE